MCPVPAPGHVGLTKLSHLDAFALAERVVTRRKNGLPGRFWWPSDNAGRFGIECVWNIGTHHYSVAVDLVEQRNTSLRFCALSKNLPDICKDVLIYNQNDKVHVTYMRFVSQIYCVKYIVFCIIYQTLLVQFLCILVSQAGLYLQSM